MPLLFRVEISLPPAAINGTTTPKSIESRAESVHEALRRAAESHPDVFKLLFDDELCPRKFVNMYVDTVDHRLANVRAPLTQDTHVKLVTSISGG